MSIEDTIGYKVAKLNEAKALISHQIKYIQDVLCSHEHVIVIHKADTGNWCKSDDRYWTENTCQDCGKRWIKEK